MSRGINKAILIGTLGKDPETKYTANGAAVCSYSIATNESWKDKNTGETKEKTEWHNITTFGKLAEICGQYLTKGSQVYIEGKIQTDKWQDKNGQDRYSTKIIANEMQMLGGGANTGTHGRAQGSQTAAPAQQDKPPASNPPDDGFDDIPFIDPYKFNWRAM